jgi:hypothetical protein
MLKRQYFPRPVDLARPVPFTKRSNGFALYFMRPSGQLVTSDTIKFQLSWRLPEPVLPADPMLTAPILPMLVRLSLPNMMAMLAMALVTIAETAYVGMLGTPPLAASRWYFR